jgi:membrane protease YdiL (CAAX protease family)
MSMLAIFYVAVLIAGICLLILNKVAPGLEREIVNIIIYSVQFLLAIGGIYGYRKFRSASGVRIMDSPFRFTFKWYNSSLLLWGIVLLFAASITLEPLLSLFPDRWFELLSDTVGRGGWAVLLTVVLAPVLEEVLFRGLILEPVRQKWGAAIGIVISAVIFGLAHTPILPQMVNALVMGIVLGYIYVLTDSLVPVIIIHAVNNGIAYLLLEIGGSQNTDMRSLIGNDGTYWIVYGVSVTIFLGSMLFMVLAARNKTDKKNVTKRKNAR